MLCGLRRQRKPTFMIADLRVEIWTPDHLMQSRNGTHSTATITGYHNIITGKCCGLRVLSLGIALKRQLVSNRWTSWYNTHSRYKSSYMFRHPGSIFRELQWQRCTGHPANLCFVHSYKLN
jgi:hypothetical protein